MSRIVTESKIEYAEYSIVSRIYQYPNRTSWFRVLTVVYINGKFYKTRRDEVSGEYYSRCKMFKQIADCHGAY